MSGKRKMEDAELSAAHDAQELERCIAAVKDGSYSELQRVDASLHAARARRLAMADKQRKLAIKNINELHEYDVRSLDSQHAKAYEAAQARLIAELQEEAARRNGSSRGDGRAHDDQSASVETKENDLNGSSVDSDATLAEAAHAQSQGSMEKLRPRHAPNIKFAIPVSSMRNDFAEIVSDLRDRAAALKDTAPEPTTAVKVIADNDSGSFHLVVGTSLFGAGDLVTVFSVLSQESFSGVVTAVSQDEVSVRCGSGARIAVYLQQLLDGRVILTQDTESIVALDTIRSATSRQQLQQQTLA